MSIPLRKPSLIGIISYTDSSTSKKCEINVRETFWRGEPYPTNNDMSKYLIRNGYRNCTDLKWTSVMH